LVGGSYGRLLHPAGEDSWASEKRLAPLTPDELSSVAEGLAASADAWIELSSGQVRRGIRIVATSLFEAWVVGWPAGTGIELCDYGASAGVFAVGSGALVETSGYRTQTPLVRRPRVVHATSGPQQVVSGQVHDLVNPGPGTAISVHVFSPRLRVMSYYEIEGDQFRCDRTEQLDARQVTEHTTGNHAP
jgi:hypothetical protein